MNIRTNSIILLVSFAIIFSSNICCADDSGTNETTSSGQSETSQSDNSTNSSSSSNNSSENSSSSTQSQAESTNKLNELKQQLDMLEAVKFQNAVNSLGLDPTNIDNYQAIETVNNYIEKHRPFQTGENDKYVPGSSSSNSGSNTSSSQYPNQYQNSSNTNNSAPKVPHEGQNTFHGVLKSGKATVRTSRTMKDESVNEEENNLNPRVDMLRQHTDVAQKESDNAYRSITKGIAKKLLGEDGTEAAVHMKNAVSSYEKYFNEKYYLEPKHGDGTTRKFKERQGSNNQQVIDYYYGKAKAELKEAGKSALNQVKNTFTNEEMRNGFKSLGTSAAATTEAGNLLHDSETRFRVVPGPDGVGQVEFYKNESKTEQPKKENPFHKSPASNTNCPSRQRLKVNR